MQIPRRYGTGLRQRRGWAVFVWGAWFVLSVAAGAPAFGGYGSAAAEVDLLQGEALVDSIPVSELLGPLAPVALSPFFGLACLSGTTLLVNRGLLPDNPLLQGNPALSHPAVFVAFLFLALATSLPRLSKVSKPLAQLLDLAETYAGVVAVLVIQWAASLESGAAAAPAAVVTAGVWDVGLDTLLMAVSAANILVIHTVRFFFEMLVLLSPVPLIDAAFETANKLVCAGLVAVYAMSPAAAFAVNLVIVLICLCLFGWAHRRTGYFKAIVLEPLWRWLRGRRDPDASASALPARLRKQFPRAWAALPVFPNRAVHGIPAYARCWLVHDGEALRLVRERRWGRIPSVDIPSSAGEGRLDLGLLANAVEWPQAGKDWPRLLFSRAYNPAAPALAEALNLRGDAAVPPPGPGRAGEWGRALRDAVRARESAPGGPPGG